MPEQSMVPWVIYALIVLYNCLDGTIYGATQYRSLIQNLASMDFTLIVHDFLSLAL